MPVTFVTDCIDAEGKINLTHYIVGYEELYKFLNLLGTVFGWVSTDVDAKLNVIRDHRKSESSENYQDVRSMLKYEVYSQLTWLQTAVACFIVIFPG